MRPNVVYRMWDTEENLLYVGLSCEPDRRLTTHATQKPWWAEVAVITLEHFPCRCSAADAEALAIRNESPRYNIATPPLPTGTWVPQIREF